MFLHSGASLHGHEYSPTNSSTAQRVPLVRSSFSAPVPRLATYDNTNPKTVQPARRTSVGYRPESENVSYGELEGDAMSEDGMSYTSEASETTTGGTKKKRRRAARSRTSYQLAHPAPTLTRQQRLLQIRPKLLLQLQQLSPDKRPIPRVDVLSSTVVVPRLMKKFPRMFKGKGELGANDVIVVRSEDYNTPDDGNESDTVDDDSLGSREVLAAICQLRGIPGGAEICLGDGSVWHGTPIAKGGFEFVTTNSVTGETTTARWVQRVTPRRHSSQPGSPISVSDAPSDEKYLFSILQPNSRRHPILASITKKILDIPDNYTTVSSSAGRHPPTSPIRAPKFELQQGADKDNLRRTTIPVDDSLRTLIQVTGVWVALRQGWCLYFKYDDVSMLGSGRPSSLSLPGHGTNSNSNIHDGNKGPGLDTQASTPESNQSSFSGVSGKILRSSNHIFRSSPSSASPTLLNQSTPLPRRAVSTGAVFMQRAAARRVGHPPSTIASDSEGELISVSPTRVTPATVTTGSTNHVSAPSTPAQVVPSAITLLDISTTPFHERVESGLIPPNPVEKSSPNGAYGQTNGHGPTFVQGTSKPPNNAVQLGKKKLGRWNSLIKFLRRKDNAGR